VVDDDDETSFPMTIALANALRGAIKGPTTGAPITPAPIAPTLAAATAEGRRDGSRSDGGDDTGRIAVLLFP